MKLEEKQLLETVHELTLLIECKCFVCRGSMRAAAECRDAQCPLRSYGPHMVAKDIELHGPEYIQPGREPEVWH
jgi:hypothetical protein